MKVAPETAAPETAAPEAEKLTGLQAVLVFRAARQQLAIARQARDAARATDNEDLASEHWNRCDGAREDLSALLGKLEDAGVLEALSALIPHIGEEL